MSLLAGRWRRAPGGSEDAPVEDAAFWTTLVRRLAAGDREAEAEFARRFYVRVRPLASVHLRWSDAAQDIAQETILAALEAARAGKIREPGKLPAFVLGVARNLINSYKRKEAQSREVRDNPPDRPVETDLILARLEEEQRALVRASLKRLNRVDRRILLLTLVDGRTPREIAPIVRLKPEVVRTRKSRAIKALADELEGATRMPRSNHVL